MSTNDQQQSSFGEEFAGVSASLGLLGWLAVAALLLSLGVTLREAISVAGVTIASDANSDADLEAGMIGVNRYNSSYERNTARIENRDIWNRPKPPPPPPPAPRPRREPDPDPGPPPPPPPPSIYAGPAIEAMMGDTVWFERGVRLSVGQGNDEVEVISTRPPWSATLLWKGVEFEVNYFDREIPRFWTEPSAGPEFQSQTDPTDSGNADGTKPSSGEQL